METTTVCYNHQRLTWVYLSVKPATYFLDATACEPAMPILVPGIHFKMCKVAPKCLPIHHWLSATLQSVISRDKKNRLVWTISCELIVVYIITKFKKIYYKESWTVKYYEILYSVKLSNTLSLKIFNFCER